MASVARAMRELYSDAKDAGDSASAELSMALNLTRRAADDELTMALDLAERLPAVWDRLAAGDIDRRRARTIAHGTAHLPAEAAQRMADRILADAGQLTTGQIAHRLRRMCLDDEPGDVEERYRHALEDRRVTIEQNASGTGNLYANDMPADRLGAIGERIHQLAMGLKTQDESRTMDQLRTDVLLDLLEGGGLHCGHTRGVVDLHVDLATLVGLRDTPGEIPGFGPIIADLVPTDRRGEPLRRMAVDARGRHGCRSCQRHHQTPSYRRHATLRRGP